DEQRTAHLGLAGPGLPQAEKRRVIEPRAPGDADGAEQADGNDPDWPVPARLAGNDLPEPRQRADGDAGNGDINRATQIAEAFLERLPGHAAVLKSEKHQQKEIDLDGKLAIHRFVAGPVSGPRTDDVGEEESRAGEADQ